MREFVKSIRSGHPKSLFAAFLYFDVSFMVWVLLGALGVFISQDLGLSATQKGLMVAVPLLGGAGFRILIGALCDRVGPKKMGIVTLLMVLIPLGWGWLAAGTFAQILMLGLLLGIAGASFAVALPLASQWYPAEHQGVAMGIAGAGNSGTVVAVLVAPHLAERFGWHAVFGLAALPVLFVLFVFFFLAKEKPASVEEKESRKGPLGLARLFSEPDLWWFCLFYSVTFGGFVGLSSFLGIFFHDQYALSKVMAGNLTAICVFAGSFFRPVGGYLADRIGGLKLLIGLYALAAVSLMGVGLIPSLGPAVGLLGSAMLFLGMGNGAIFQMVPQRFGGAIGRVSGIVGAAGGIGGFFLPSMLGGFKDLTGGYTAGFFTASGLGLLCLGALIRYRVRWEPVWLPASVRKAPEIPIMLPDPYRVKMEVVFGG